MASNTDSPFEPFDAHNGHGGFIDLDRETMARVFAREGASRRKTTSILTVSFVRNFIDTFKAQSITSDDLTRALVNYENLEGKLYHYYNSLISQAISLLNFYFPEGSPPPPATLLGKVPASIRFDMSFAKSKHELPPDPEPALPQEIVLLRLRGIFAGVDALSQVMDEVYFRRLDEFTSCLDKSNMGFRVVSAYTAARCKEEMDKMVGAVRKWLSESNIDQYESIFQELQWLMEPDSVTIRVSVDGYRKGNNPRRRTGYRSN